MAVITFPTTMRAMAECTIGQARYDMTESSDSTGNEAARLFAPPRWKMTLSSVDALSLADAGTVEALLLQLRGRVNHLAAFDPVRTQPQGTLRGLPVTRDNLAAGATTMALVGATAGTLKAGDWLQVGTGLGTSQLVKVMADTVSSPAIYTAFTWTSGGAFAWDSGGSAFTWEDGGTIGVTFEPPLRQAYLSGSVITWNRPVGYYKQTSEPQWAYGAGRTVKGFAVDLLEAFN